MPGRLRSAHNLFREKPISLVHTVGTREKDMNQDTIDWLTLHLLPFEAELRLRLRRVCASAADVDDVIQEVYCKVMQMDEVAHVNDPRGYFVQMAKNLITDRL